MVPNDTYDPIVVNSGNMIYNHIKHVHVEFRRGNKIFKLIIIAEHIFLKGPILDVGAIINRP